MIHEVFLTSITTNVSEFTLALAAKTVATLVAADVNSLLKMLACCDGRSIAVVGGSSLCGT